jgi:hypothetical protein
VTLPDRATRTAALTVLTNPHRGQELLSRFKWTIQVGSHNTSLGVTVALVPDRDLPAPGAIEAYLNGLTGLDWPTLEALCGQVLDDVSDTLVPLLTMVEVAQAAAPDAARHVCTVRRLQPGYTPSAFIENLLRSE